MYVFWSLFIFIHNFTIVNIQYKRGQRPKEACKHDIYLQFRNKITDSILFSEGQSIVLWLKHFVITLHRRGLVTPPFPLSDFLLSISVFFVLFLV